MAYEEVRAGLYRWDGKTHRDEDSVMCLFMEDYPPKKTIDPAKECHDFARWHIRYVEDAAYEGHMTSSCEAHLGRALAWREVIEFHEFMSACNLPQSWWMGDNCMTEDVGLDLGLLETVPEEEPV